MRLGVWVRCGDYLTALLASLACGLALSSYILPLGGMNALKAMATITLLVASVGSPWWLSARLVASVLFIIFAAYNFGGATAGRGDCGCFPVSISPYLTGLFDICLGGWFAVRTRSLANERWLVLLACFSVVIGFIMGLLAPESRGANSPSMAGRAAANLVMAPIPVIGEELFSSGQDARLKRMTVFVHRGSCLHCQEQLARLAIEQSHSPFHLIHHLQVELDQRKITNLDGSSVKGAEVLLPLLDRAKFWPLPVFITVVEGKVESVVDLSR